MNCPKCDDRMTMYGDDLIEFSQTDKDTVTGIYDFYCRKCKKHRYLRKEFKFAGLKWVDTRDELFGD